MYEECEKYFVYNFFYFCFAFILCEYAVISFIGNNHVRFFFNVLPSALLQDKFLKLV